MWKLVLAVAAALAARPDAPRQRSAPPPPARQGAATTPAPALAPAPLDTAPNTAPDPGTPATVDPQKQPKHWEW